MENKTTKRLSNNKVVGKIYSFDGEAGIIVSSDEYYHFNKKDLLSTDIKIGDMVSFVSNTLIFIDEKEYVALYIEKIDEKDIK